MNVFMIGGTGLLGSAAAAELIARGHQVSSVALPPLPQGAVLPNGLHLTFANYLEMSDDELARCLSGCDGFIFAAGVDERVEGPAPIADLYRKYNIDPLKRLLPLAKKQGVKHVVVLGSYFAYFDKLWPEKRLSSWHPYIKSRREQEDVCLSFSDEQFDVAVLELPYIFGTQPGRKPVWVFLVQYIRSMKLATFYPRGGTTMVTVTQVAQAVAGAVERNRGGNCYPIGWYNMRWKELLAIIQRYLGVPGRKIITIPDWMFTLAGKRLRKQQQAHHIDGGLNLAKLADIQCAELFIDKSLGCEPLGVLPDDMEKAIGESIKLCVDVMEKRVETVGMRGE
jgi:dihydroflavonol-4-reductase